jgi:hypothetical protein
MAHAFPGTDTGKLTVGEYVSRLPIAHQIISQHASKSYNDDRLHRHLANRGIVERETEDLPI